MNVGRVGRIDEDVAAQHEPGLHGPSVGQFGRRQNAGVRERVVQVGVGVREQGRIDRVGRLDAVVRKEMPNLDIHALGDAGKIGLAVKLDRVDSVRVRPAVIVGELSAEESASQREPVI